MLHNQERVKHIGYYYQTTLYKTIGTVYSIILLEPCKLIIYYTNYIKHNPTHGLTHVAVPFRVHERGLL